MKERQSARSLHSLTESYKRNLCCVMGAWVFHVVCGYSIRTSSRLVPRTLRSAHTSTATARGVLSAHVALCAHHGSFLARSAAHKPTCATLTPLATTLHTPAPITPHKNRSTWNTVAYATIAAETIAYATSGSTWNTVAHTTIAAETIAYATACVNQCQFQDSNTPSGALSAVVK